jgi:hypothetical protein
MLRLRMIEALARQQAHIYTRQETLIDIDGDGEEEFLRSVPLTFDASKLTSKNRYSLRDGKTGQELTWFVGSSAVRVAAIKAGNLFEAYAKDTDDRQIYIMPVKSAIIFQENDYFIAYRAGERRPAMLKTIGELAQYVGGTYVTK